MQPSIAVCSNPMCRTSDTPLWRRIEGALFCNACALYKKRTGLDRLPNPEKKPQKRPNRASRNKKRKKQQESEQDQSKTDLTTHKTNSIKQPKRLQISHKKRGEQVNLSSQKNQNNQNNQNSLSQKSNHKNQFDSQQNPLHPNINFQKDSFELESELNAFSFTPDSLTFPLPKNNQPLYPQNPLIDDNNYNNNQPNDLIIPFDCVNWQTQSHQTFEEYWNNVSQSSVLIYPGDCVGLRTVNGYEIFALVKNIIYEMETHVPFLQVQWLIPKSANKFGVLIGFGLEDFTSPNDFLMGNEEPIPQSILSITRKLPFHFLF